VNGGITLNESPFRARHNQPLSERALKELYKDGTPAWIARPKEFRQYAVDCYLADKEESDAMVAQYRMEDQEELTDRKARLVNVMGTRDFIEKLRSNGVHCFTYQVPPGEGTPKELLNTVGLWCEVPTERNLGHEWNGHKHQYICYLQIPAMHEWSLLRLDDHKLPIGEAHRGWRTVLSQLILKGVLTEEKAHLIFGKPSGPQSLKYRRTLHDFRNGRYPNERREKANI